VIKAASTNVIDALQDHARRTADGFELPRAIFVGTQSDIAQDLEGALRYLDPLVQGSYPTRELVLDTQRKGWSRIFSNNLMFAGLPSRGAFLTKQLKTESVFFMLQPHTIHGAKPRSGGEPGAIQFVYYDRGTKRRVVELVYDGTWKFHASGDAFPFEQAEKYKARNRIERFTPGMLIKLLADFGLCPFEDDFYKVDSKHLARGVALEIRNRELLEGEFKPVSLDKLRRQWSPADTNS
jgi:hypothetical protein